VTHSLLRPGAHIVSRQPSNIEAATLFPDMTEEALKAHHAGGQTRSTLSEERTGGGCRSMFVTIGAWRQSGTDEDGVPFSLRCEEDREGRR
jgi:hypothetical protein